MKLNRPLVVAVTKLWLVMLCFVAGSLTVQAQTVIIGANNGANLTTDYPCPLQDYYRTQRAHWLYTAAELSAQGITPGAILTNVGWVANATVVSTAGQGLGYLIEGFSIKLKNTATSSLPALSAASWETGASQVYGPTNYVYADNTSGNITFPISAFVYTGGNLLIETCGGDPAVSYSGNPAIQWTTGLAFNGSYYYRSDTEVGVCSYSGLGTNVGLGTSRPRLVVTYIPGSACSGTPTPGNTLADVSGTVCPSQFFNLSLSGVVTLGTGTTFQWQSSTDGINYTNISGATGLFYSTNQGASTYYRCFVTCSNSGLSDYSNPLQILSASGPMSGIFTINSAVATGGSNYQSFSAAANDLNCRGINGPVTFNVNASSGPYNEQVNLSPVVGASSVNTITFNGNGRTLTYSASLSTAPHTLVLNGTDWVRVNNLNVIGTGATYAMVVHLWNQADNNIFTNCIFSCPANGTSSLQSPFSLSGSATSPTTSGVSGNNNIVDGCTMNSGYYNTCMVGNSASPNTGNMVINSTMQDFYFYGSYNVYQTGLIIRNNIVQRQNRTTLSTFYGIYVSTSCNSLLAERNRIRHPFGAGITNSSSAYAIYDFNAGVSGSERRFYNNQISDFNSNGLIWAMYLSGATYVKVYHNTVALTQTASTATSTTYGIYSTGTAGIDIRNNDVMITRGGSGIKYCLYFSGAGKVSNRNNLYMGSVAGTRGVGFYVSTFVTLANWQTANAAAWDQNSVSVDPAYLSPGTGNFQPVNGLMNNVGAAVGVTNDLNGTVRSLVTPDMGAYEFSLTGLDAGITWVSPPSPSTTGMKTITVNISNNLTDPITELNLSYSDGGVPVTELFTGLNIAGSTNQNFSFSVQYNLLGTTNFTASILSVNGGADALPANNTVTQSVCIGLSGVYTINSAVATGGTNYQTFTSAVSALSCGIAGPVTFNVVASSGPYNEQVLIPQITGTSAVNTITFNGNNCTLSYNSTNSLLPSTFELGGTDWVRVNDLNIEGLGASYALVCHLWNQSDNNIFNNCIFTAPANGTSSFQVPFSISGSQSSATTSGSCGNNNQVIGCTMKNGYYSTVIYGNSASPFNVGNKVLNCNVQDFYLYGIYNVYCQNTLFKGNTVSRPTRTNSTTAYCIYLSSGSVSCIVDGNRVKNIFGGAPGNTNTVYCLYNGVSSSAGFENKWINNIVSGINSAGAIYGMYAPGYNYVHIYHNTFAFDDASATTSSVTYAMYVGGTGMSIRNNSVYVARGGSGTKYCIYMSGNLATCNNNNFYMSPTAGGTLNYLGYYNANFSTLANWQTANGGTWDLNSTSADPIFIDPGNDNFQPSSVGVDNTGAPLGITLDINNNLRSLTTPDVGAVEFILSPTDLGPVTILTPAQGECVTSAQSIVLRVRNFGTQPLNFANNPATLSVNVTGTTIATLSNTINSGILPVNATMDVTLTGTFNMSVIGAYVFNGSAFVVGDGNSFNDALITKTVSKTFNIGSISSSSTTHCASSVAPTISLAASTGGNIQWQSSTVGISGPWTNVGTNATSYNPGSLIQTSYFKAVYTCESLNAESNVVTVVVNNPQIASSAPGSRCGAGAVTLGATPNGGYNVNWYDTPVGGGFITQGASYTTPLISNTTTYYAAASTGGGGSATFSVNPLIGGNGCGGGNMFNITPVTSIDITGFIGNLSVTGSSTVKIYYKTGTYVGSQASSAGWILHETVSVTSPGSNLPTPVTLASPLTLIGGQQYAIFFAAPVNYTNITPPVYVSNTDMLIELGDGLCSEFGGNNVGRAFNGSIIYAAGCVGTRTAVVATVTPSIPVAAASNDTYVCSGNPIDLSVTSANSNYNYTWTSEPAGFNATGAGPINANPTPSSITYRVYALDPSDNCGALDYVTVTTTPNLINLTASATPAAVCSGSDAQLNANAFIGSDVSTYSFAASSGTFTPLVGGYPETTILGDDAISGTIPIGFQFNFEGTNYSTLVAGSNGVLFLGTSGTTSTQPLLASTTPRPFIAPLADDLHGASGTASYLMSGPVGNRVFTFEWLNWRWYYTVATPSISIQCKLYEVDGKIEFIYQQESAPLTGASESASIGLAGYNNNKFLSLTNASAAPATNSITEINTINTKPNNGQVYTFTPPAGAVFSYDWSGNSNYLSSTSVSNPIAQAVTTNEVYTITVTDAASGCIKTNTYNLDALPLPIPGATSNAPVCENADVYFSAYDGASYSWTGPSGFTSSGIYGNATVYGAQLSNSGNYSVQVVGLNGCTQTETISVQVNDNPEPIQASMSPVDCYGSSTGSFQVAVNGGTPFFSFVELSNQVQNFTGSFSGLADGTYYVEVTDLNQCASVSPLEVTVTTVPNIAPVISCPTNVVKANDLGSCGSIVNYSTPVGSDVCPVTGTLQTNGLATGTSFPIGTTVNTFEVTDALGLTATCSFSVTVTDAELPTVVNCPSSFSSCNPISWTPPIITDNCLGLQVSSTHTPGVNFPSGTTLVTYTAIDAANNNSYCSFSVTRLEESVKADNITSNRDFNNICSGDNITLTINGGSLGAAANWKWYTGTCGGTALPAFNGLSSITVSPTVTTTYFARAEGQCNTTICESITVVVSTNSPNSVVITGVPSIAAPGVTGVVTCTAVPGATFYRWTSILGHINAIWFNGAPGPIETTTNSVNVAFQLPQSNYQIRVVAGNACGRSNNASAQIRGTVPAPICLNGPAVACPLQVATYSVAACLIPGTSDYQWAVTGNANILSGQGTPTITVQFGPGFTSAQVCVNGVSTFGLAGPQACLSISNNTAAPGPITGNNLPCSSSTEGYSIAPVANATSYLWTTNIVGAIASGNTVNGSIQYPLGTFNGQVCVQAVSSCGTSLATCYNVTSGTPGNPGAIGGPVAGICGASNVNYALGTNDAVSYSWALPTGATIVSGGTSNSVNINFPAGMTGPQTITVTAHYACGDASSSIIVDGAPAIPTVTPATICAGSDALYFASSAGADNYTWTATGADYEECTNGAIPCSQYYVIWNANGGTMSVTASNTCGTSAPFSMGTNCRISNSGNMDTKVYPNPTDGNLTILFNSYAGGQYNLTVTDMAGRTFLREDVKANSGLNEHIIDLGTANPGMYMLYLKDAAGDISVNKITVE